jgi:hypothetical protein
MANGKREKGLRVLSKFRNLPLDHPYMKEEIAQIDLGIEEQARTIGLGFNAPFKEVAHKRNIQWRMFLAGSLFFWQNGSGINAINVHHPISLRSWIPIANMGI